MEFILVMLGFSALLGAAIGANKQMGTGGGMVLGLVLGLLGVVIVACSANKIPPAPRLQSGPSYPPPAPNLLANQRR